MKGNYSIGYKDKYGDFSKVWYKGSTRKFNTIDECKEYIINNKECFLNDNIRIFKIMIGWKIIELFKL